jgi:hypothetical protein
MNEIISTLVANATPAANLAETSMEAIVIASDGEPLFNEQDTEALARHNTAANHAYKHWRTDYGMKLTARAVIEVGRNWAACKRIAKDAFKDWYEYTGGSPVEMAECFINAYELSLKHNAISNLSANAILMLSCLSTPEAARTKIIKRVDACERLSKDKVEAIIRKANGGRKVALNSGQQMTAANRDIGGPSAAACSGFSFSSAVGESDPAVRLD